VFTRGGDNVRKKRQAKELTTMTKRILLLGALAAALVIPAVSLADDGGGSTPAPTVGAKGGRAVALLERITNRLDKRFQMFSSHCLVANAPERCGKAANRFVTRLDRLQGVLHKVEDKIREKCTAANPPVRCSSASQVTQAIDTLLAKITSDETAIKDAFPSAGSA
jgi:hypothetical protein